MEKMTTSLESSVVRYPKENRNDISNLDLVNALQFTSFHSIKVKFCPKKAKRNK